jgi:hypothetical protein
MGRETTTPSTSTAREFGESFFSDRCVRSLLGWATWARGGTLVWSFAEPPVGDGSQSSHLADLAPRRRRASLARAILDKKIEFATIPKSPSPTNPPGSPMPLSAIQHETHVTPSKPTFELRIVPQSRECHDKNCNIYFEHNS